VHRVYYRDHVIKLDRGKDFLFLGYICLLYLNMGERNYAPTAHKLKLLYQVSAAMTR
jgi:hypothetical protein